MSHLEEWWPFVFRMIPLDQLEVERFDGTSGYQRSLSDVFVTESLNSFDPIRFEPLTVVPVYEGDNPHGRFRFYSVIDGQHRRAMAAERSYALVPCNVFNRTLTYEGRAWQFYKLNTARRQANIREGTRALFENKDKTLLALMEACNRHGFYLDGYRPGEPNGHRALAAIGVLRKQFKTDQQAVDRALYVLEEWRTLGTRRTQGNVITALCVLARKDGLDADRLRDVLARHGPIAIEREAGEVAAQMQTGITSKAIRMVLQRHYNHGLRSRRLTFDDE